MYTIPWHPVHRQHLVSLVSRVVPKETNSNAIQDIQNHSSRYTGSTNVTMIISVLHTYNMVRCLSLCTRYQAVHCAASKTHSRAALQYMGTPTEPHRDSTVKTKKQPAHRLQSLKLWLVLVVLLLRLPLFFSVHPSPTTITVAPCIT